MGFIDFLKEKCNLNDNVIQTLIDNGFEDY
jgi:hypothetical protein